MKELRFVLCGAGQRGSSMARGVICKLEGVKLVGICDTAYIDKAEACANDIQKKYAYTPAVYNDYEKMFTELEPDAVFIATSWEDHSKVAISAMKKGIAVASEVGGAYSEAECLELVRVYEETKTPYMFMENCCFNKDELLVTSMAKKGILGDIVYCHGAYAHDLREEIAFGDINRHYRLRNYSNRNGDNYPTHELGPIAKLLNINRGNRMISLTSRASKAIGLHEYIQDKKELEYLKDREFKQGDIVETLIQCENGELISLRLDTTLPRFYSREFTVRGTKGLYMQDNNMVLIDGQYEEIFEPHIVMNQYHNNAEAYSEYLPKLWADVTPEILAAGHGGMDYFVVKAFVDALRSGEEMPIDIYDAVSWMAITYLSEASIQNNGAPMEIPDFTNGAYKTRPPKDVVKL